MSSQKLTKTLYLRLLEIDEPVVCDKAFAARVGRHYDTVRREIYTMVEDGIVKRVGHGLYALTGEPLTEKVAILDREPLDPRPIRKSAPLDRWRSLTGRLLGDPPIGRSALDLMGR